MRTAEDLARMAKLEAYAEASRAFRLVLMADRLGLAASYRRASRAYALRIKQLTDLHQEQHDTAA